jgi:FemAB-related protein (PEP-CTERM system-associated)
MEIVELTPQLNAQWDAYVQSSPDTTFYYPSAWREVLRRAYGHPLIYLMARQGGDVRGVLPLIYIRSPIGGHHLDSLPGGLCADDLSSAEALVAHAQDLTHSLGADYLLLRDGVRPWPIEGLTTLQQHVTLVTPIPDDADSLWKSVDRDARRLVRRSREAGITIEIDPSFVDEFWRIYSTELHDKGTPVPPASLFRQGAHLLGDDFTVLGVKRNGDVIGAGCLSLFRDTAWCSWGASLRREFDYYPNYLLHWHILDYARQHGYQYVDLGRSQPGSNAYQFKKKWGGQMQHLYRQHWLRTDVRVPDLAAETGQRPYYRLLTTLWRLLPLSMSRVLGPAVRRHIPFG